MTESLYSHLWHQVAALKPRWRTHARCDRQSVRDETWYVVTGDGRTQTLRLDALAWMIAGRCDGQTSVAQIWEAALAAQPERAPTQDQTIDLIARLVQERCLDCAGMPDLSVLQAEDGQRLRRARWARLHPLALRVGLGDPTAWLRPLLPWGRGLFGLRGAVLWAGLMLWAAIVLVMEWGAVSQHARTWLQSPRYVLLAWAVWLPMKVVHEGAHALAIMRWGGHVREAGIAFMLGWPVPYVDAVAADRFAWAHQRAVVSAAGIMAEMALAAFGLLAWSILEPGWLRDVGFALAAAGAVSTLLFNGNPLMKMDGYFVLCDAAGLPNLAARSGAWWRAAMQRGLGWTQAYGPRLAARERPWLVAYAPLAWCWRVSLLSALAWWAAGWHAWLGYLTLGGAAVGLVVRPLSAVVQGPARAGAAWAVRWRFQARVFGLVGLLSGFLWVPLPDRVVVPAVVQAPEDSLVRAGVEGFVEASRSEGPVTPSETLLEMMDPMLQQAAERLQQQYTGAEAEWMGALRTDPARAAQAQLRLESITTAWQDAQSRLAALTVRAPYAGMWVLERGVDGLGAFVHEGDVLGRIVDGRPPILRVAVDQDDAARARLSPPRALAVRVAQQPGKVWRGHLVRHGPAAIQVLPGAALSDRFGGAVAVDPTDAEGLRPAYPTYLLDVAVAWSQDEAPRAGGRAWVRLDYGYASLLQQTWRWMRQTLRARFEMADA